MNTNRKWQKIGGWVLHGLVAGIMTLAGSAKVLGLFPPEEIAKLGLGVPIQVIGVGELASAILLLIPHLVAGAAAHQRILGRRHLSAHV